MNGSTRLVRLTIAGVVCALADAAAAPASAQDLARYARPLIVEVRSEDSTRAAGVEIAAGGEFLVGVGVLDPVPGGVRVINGRRRVRTPAILEFGDGAGWVTLVADREGPAIQLLIRAGDASATQNLARGRAIRIDGDAEGRIRVGVSGRGASD